MLRATPNLLVFRPADAVETAECWEIALERSGRPRPCSCLSRQALPTLRTEHRDEQPLRPRRLCAARAGGRARRDAARHRLGGRDRGRRRPSASPREGVAAAVVSMPCWELFERAGRDATASAVLGRGPARRGRGGRAPRLGPLDRRGRRLHRHDAVSAPPAPRPSSTGISASRAEAVADAARRLAAPALRRHPQKENA